MAVPFGLCPFGTFFPFGSLCHICVPGSCVPLGFPCSVVPVAGLCWLMVAGPEVGGGLLLRSWQSKRWKRRGDHLNTGETDGGWSGGDSLGDRPMERPGRG